MGRPIASRPTERVRIIPGLRAAMIDHTRRMIAAYHDTTSIQYEGLGLFKRDAPPKPELQKRRVHRLGELLERLESGEPVRVRPDAMPPEYRRRLPAGTPLDYYIITADDEVSIEERVSSR